MGSMSRLPCCGVCGALLGSRPWPVLVVADEPAPGVVMQALAEGSLPVLYLCKGCDAAVMAVLTVRQTVPQ